MSLKKKKIISVTLITVAALLVTVVLAGFLALKFWFLPKYNEGRAEPEKLTVMEILGFAGKLADKQVIDNVKNFDKASAKEVLTILVEAEDEAKAEEPTPKPVKKHTAKATAWGSSANRLQTEIETKKEAAKPTPEPKPSGKQGTAYDRIMAAASKEEIAAGMAILSKVDMGKVNALRSTGKTAELKRYIKSVLSSSEIRTALRLYNKYAHLL